MIDEMLGFDKSKGWSVEDDDDSITLNWLTIPDDGRRWSAIVTIWGTILITSTHNGEYKVIGRTWWRRRLRSPILSTSGASRKNPKHCRGRHRRLK